MLLAAAAEEAGLLARPARRVLVIKAKGHGTGPAHAALDLARQLCLVDDVLTPAELLDHPDALGPGPGHDEEPELVVGTTGLSAARSLSRRWGAARVTLLAAGASAYGPTQEALQGRLAKRVDAMVHLDLVPGLVPLLLSERSVPTRTVPPAGYRSV